VLPDGSSANRRRKRASARLPAALLTRSHGLVQRKRHRWRRASARHRWRQARRAARWFGRWPGVVTESLARNRCQVRWARSQDRCVEGTWRKRRAPARRARRAPEACRLKVRGQHQRLRGRLGSRAALRSGQRGPCTGAAGADPGRPVMLRHGAEAGDGNLWRRPTVRPQAPCRGRASARERRQPVRRGPRDWTTTDPPMAASAARRIRMWSHHP
jgi:hypothetical protein